MSLMLTFLFVTSLLKRIEAQYLMSNFNVQKNILLDLKFNETFLLDSFNTASQLFCLVECIATDTCVSCAYDNAFELKATINCYLYNTQIAIYTVSTNSTITLFNKLCQNGEMLKFDSNCFSLKEIFIKKNLIQTIGPSNLMSPYEFQIESKKPHNYYITNFGNNSIVILDRNWNYLKRINNNKPRDIKILDNFTYILSEDGFRKFDNNFQQMAYVPNMSSSLFLRLYYSEIYNYFYLSINTCPCIYLFDTNLSLVGNISLGTYIGFTFKEHKGKLYVGTRNRAILVIQNRTVIGNYTNICNKPGDIRGICIDYEGYMAVTCPTDNSVFLYHINGTNTGKSITVPNAYFAKFDLNGNFAILDNTNNLIYLYK